MLAEAPAHLRTVRDWLRFAVSRFNEAGLSFGHGSLGAHDEAAYLILHTLHLPLDRLEPYLDAALLPGETAALAEILRRRIEQRIPAAYLTREAWLGDYRFYVDERVIVPRSFIAELVPDGLLPWIGTLDSVHRAIDLCTGSGCLAILMADSFANAIVDATDLSADAIEVARRNIADYGMRDRVHVLQGDLFCGSTQRYDLIVSNPPYVNRDAMEALPPEFRAEPRMALTGGEDGLDVVRRILADAGARLTENGILVVEIGHNREALERAFPRLAFTWLETSAGDGHVFLLTASQLER
jgi:ribosomal protein L3 glutamine methyltransferase